MTRINKVARRSTGGMAPRHASAKDSLVSTANEKERSATCVRGTVVSDGGSTTIATADIGASSENIKSNSSRSLGR